MNIVWDGQAPGLAEHQLSVAALSSPLELLLKAVRRVASSTIKRAKNTGKEPPDDAFEDSELGGKGGRLVRGVDKIDLRIKGIGHGCLSLDLEIVFPEELEDPQGSLFDAQLADATMANLLGAIEAESRGEHRSAAVRRFLRSLAGVSSQRYALRRDGQTIKEVRLADASPPPAPVEHPYLIGIRGAISGVRFPPGEPQVLITTADGRGVALVASAAQVDQALALRGVEVEVRAMTALRGAKARLISIRQDAAATRGAVETPDAAALQAYVLRRWAGTLERLAQ